jgi:hypothetical protein
MPEALAYDLNVPTEWSAKPPLSIEFPHLISGGGPGLGAAPDGWRGPVAGSSLPGDQPQLGHLDLGVISAPP